MASYTMGLNEYIEMYSQENENLSLNEKIEIGRKKLFDFSYPIFDSSYKNVFETNFIKHFYMREIGFETEYLFKFRLETWLNINMPYFNKLFESELIKFDPLINENVKTDYRKQKNGSNTNDRNYSKRDTSNTDKTNFKDSNENGKRDNSQSDERKLDYNKDETGKDKTLTSDKLDSKVTNKATGETTGDSTGKATVKTTGKDDAFGRKLESTTPDSRLQITTNDGKGVIEYASKIDENKTTSSNENNSTTDTTDKTKTNSKTDTSIQDYTQKDITVNKDTSLKDKITENENNEKVFNEIYNKTDLTNERGNISENKQSTITDGVRGSMNGFEDYVQNKLGKTGTVTHSQMLKEFRETFLRLEKEIFYEMNELFMLVY